MKPIFVHTAGAIALTAIVAACTSAPVPTSAPAPAPVARPPAPAPSPPEPPAPIHEDWMDAPATLGNWVYRDASTSTRAEFGSGTAVLFAIRCDRERRQVSLQRATASASANQMTVRTGTRDISLSGRPTPDGNAVTVTLDSGAPLLDAMALARGRFAVEVAGYPALYLPNWAEVARVVEDCR